MGRVAGSTRELKATESHAKVPATGKLRRVQDEVPFDAAFFRRLIDSVPYPQYLINARDMTVTWQNSAAGQSQLPSGVPCYSYIRGRNRPCGQAGYLCLLEQASLLKRFVLVEESWRDDNGATSHVEFQGFPVFDANGNVQYLLETRVDISKRKRAEQALYESEQKYRTLFQEANDAIFLIDADSGYILNANRAAERLLGLSLDEIMVMHQAEILTPQILDQIKAEDQASTKRTIDAQVVRRDGFVVPVCISSSAVVVHGRTLVQRVIRDMTEYRQAEARLIEYQEQLRNLAAQLSLAQERERRRIAAQVHDSIGQNMAACAMKLGMLAESLAGTPLARDVMDISALVKQTIEDARSLAYEISPPLLYEIGLEAAVEKLTEQMRERCGIQFSFVHDGRLAELDNDTRITVFQALRELLVNAMKHSQARHVQIDIRGKGGSLCAMVTDDGVGFDTARTTSWVRAKGFGLFSIRERLESVGGHMVVESQPGGGTHIAFSVPLRRSEGGAKGDVHEHHSPAGR